MFLLQSRMDTISVWSNVCLQVSKMLVITQGELPKNEFAASTMLHLWASAR